MVNRKFIKKKFQEGICCIFIICVIAFSLIGCQTAEQTVKNTADEVVKADQWFRDKFW